MKCPERVSRRVELKITYKFTKNFGHKKAGSCCPALICEVCTQIEKQTYFTASFPKLEALAGRSEVCAPKTEFA